MTRVQDLIGDLDAAIERLRQASGTDERRRAFKCALAELYMLREYREGDAGQTGAYHRRASMACGGKVTEGICLIRGVMTHHVTKEEIAPKRDGVFPGDGTFPGEDVYPGEWLVWLRLDEMAPYELTDKYDRVPYYEELVGGQPVLETLVVARDFLVNDKGPGL